MLDRDSSDLTSRAFFTDSVESFSELGYKCNMKKLLKLTTICLLTLSSVLHAEVVTLNFSNMAGIKGQLAVAVFDKPDSFPDQTASAVLTKFYPLPTALNATTVTVDLKPGRYAIAALLDQNKNQKLDTNMVGAPKERFGFSQNPRITFSAPNFAESAFEVEANKKKVLEIRLIKLF